MSTDSTIVDQFIALFRGRHDAYGTEEGGCERVKIDDPLAAELHEELRFIEHLDGEAPMGVYPFLSNGTVTWGCVDFDLGEDESWAHAVNLTRLLRKLGVDAWPERSRSKGYHVWVFPEQPVPAATMRRALIVACKAVKAPITEVNPKQERLDEGKIGNYVRLPYPGGEPADGPQGPGMHRCMVEWDQENWPMMGKPITLEWFLKSTRKAPVAIFEKLAAKYVPETPPRVTVTLPPEGGSITDKDMVKRMSGLAFTIFENGPLDGADRSGTMWKLACKLIEDGQHTESEIRMLMHDYDWRHGKFNAKGKPDEVDKLIDKALGRR